MASSNRHWPSMYRSSLACNFQQPQPDMNNGGKSSLMSSSMHVSLVLSISMLHLYLHITVSCCMLRSAAAYYVDSLGFGFLKPGER